MALDRREIERLLREGLCAEVRIHRREDGVLMMESPFTFPDGDGFPIYLSETEAGDMRLSDRGHTLMHLSYEHDVDLLYEGPRASLREQIVRESGIREDGGTFSIDTRPDQVAGALFRFGQALTKIYDLTFLSRDQTASTFYENLRGAVFTILDEEVVESDYIATDVPCANHYPVDYRFAGKDGQSVFLYGVPSRDQARLTTIMLSHFLLHKLSFESVIVFADQQDIPRLELARLTNVAGTAVASLEAEEDLRRKIEHLPARPHASGSAEDAPRRNPDPVS